MRSAGRIGFVLVISTSMGYEPATQSVSVEQTSLSRGQRVGRFVVERRLGGGGFGEVYLAMDETLKRSVAIKLYRRTVAGSAVELLQQSQAMGHFQHPNIATVYEVGIHQGVTFVAMEYVEGEDLARWVRHLDPSPKLDARHRNEVLDAFRQAAQGLAAVHRTGIAHGDFKPQNVLRGDDGRIRITDFGMAASVRNSPGWITVGGVAGVAFAVGTVLTVQQRAVEL